MTKLQHCRVSAAPVTLRNLTRDFLSRLAPVFVFALSLATPSQHASASQIPHCSAFGPIPVLGYPTGATCIDVDGTGLKVHSVTGSFTASEVCNWRYDIIFTNTQGKAYTTVKGLTHSGCTRGRGHESFTFGRKGRFYTTAREGQVCARLYSSGSPVDAACVSIYP
jgi:hypothetical protein